MRHRPERHLVLAALLCVGGLACSSTMAVHPVDYLRRAGKPLPEPGCRARLVDAASEVPSYCEVVGDVFIGDTGFSTDCGEERVRGDLEVEACALGGDVALVQEVHDGQTSCFEARAIVLECGKPDATIEEAR